MVQNKEISHSAKQPFIEKTNKLMKTAIVEIKNSIREIRDGSPRVDLSEVLKKYNYDEYAYL